MFLQRLKLDDEIGFNYDYMGAAEYENGATRAARDAMARAYIEEDVIAKTTRFVELYGQNRVPPVDVVILGRTNTIKAISKDMIIRVWKEPFLTDRPNIVAWMRVEAANLKTLEEPLFIVRTSVDNIMQRVNDFFEPAILQMRIDLESSS